MRRITTAFVALALAATMVTSTGCSASTDVEAQPESSGQEASVELQVSAATTLKRAFEELEPDFEEANNCDIVYNFASSGQLQLQIEGGALADVFASASPKQVDALVGEEFISVEDTATFCSNDVVIFVPAGNPAGIDGPEDLGKAERLTTGDPETAPHGTKSKEWLEAIDLWSGLESKFVFGENAAQTLDYVARGEVDAGLGFASEAFGRDDVEIVYTVPAEELNPVRYVIAPLAETDQSELAAAFIDYILSEDGQAVLADYGFKPLD